MFVASSKSDELELLEGLREGAPTSLRRLYDTYFKPVAAYIIRNGGNEEDAKDVFQETVMVLYRMVQKEDFELRSALLSLLIGIGKKVWLSSLRKRPLYVEVSDPNFQDELVDLDDDITETLRNRRIDQLFREKLNALGAQCQEILKLFFEGRKMKEIVTEIGLSSISFAKKKKFQCKERLVDLVQTDPIYQELKI